MLILAILANSNSCCCMFFSALKILCNAKQHSESVYIHRYYISYVSTSSDGNSRTNQKVFRKCSDGTRYIVQSRKQYLNQLARIAIFANFLFPLAAATAASCLYYTYLGSLKAVSICIFSMVYITAQCMYFLAKG